MSVRNIPSWLVPGKNDAILFIGRYPSSKRNVTNLAVRNNLIYIGISKIKQYLSLLGQRFSRKHFGELGWLAGGQLASMLLSLLVMKLLTRMGPNEYGKYALALTFVGFLNSVLYGPIEQSFVRYIEYYINKGKGKVFFELVLKVLIYSGLLFLFVGIACGIGVVVAGVYENPIEGLAVIVFVILSATTPSPSSLLNVLRKRNINAFLQVVERFLVVVLLYAAGKYILVDVSIAVTLMSVSVALVLGVKIFMLRNYVYKREGKQEVNGGNYQEMLLSIKSFGAPFIIWGFFGWLQLNAERWILAQYCSVATVGFYFVILNISNIFIVIPQGVLSQFVTPIIYSRFLDLNDSRRIKEGYQYLTLFIYSVASFVFVAIILVTIWGRDIIEIVSNSSYVLYADLLPLLCAGVGLFYLGQTLCLFGMSVNQPKKYLAPKIINGLFALACYYFFTKAMGLKGIVIAIYLAGLIYLLSIYFVNKKILRSLKLT